VEADYVVAQVALLAETASARFADARLEASVHPLVPMDTKYPVEGLLAVATLELAGRNLLNLAHNCHLGHLANQRVAAAVQLLDGAHRLQV